MNIIYLNGPFNKKAFSRSSRSPAVTKSGTIYYPIWLAYAAGVAQQRLHSDTEKINIELLDAAARKFNARETVQYLQASPPDIVFCDTSTPSIYEDIITAGAIKEAFQDCKVIMVGTHATAMACDVLNADQRIDAVARGEYDITSMEICQAVLNGKSIENVDGISYRSGDQIINNPDRELISDLDSLPFVSSVYKKFLNVRDYVFSAAQFPMIMIITSRGCTNRCKWCLYPQVMHRGKYRMRSPENIAAEFAYIAKELPDVREIGIEDDLFTGDLKRLRKTCELLIEQGNQIDFWCDTRVDLDFETMQLLKKAGCRLLVAGFESGDEEILKNINKRATVQQGREFMANARKAKLLVHGCFVFGNPGETPELMQKTLDMAIELDPDTAQFFPVIVYPGTQMYSWAEENKYLNTTNFNKWLTPQGMHNSVVDLPGLKGCDVVGFCDHARRSFYLRRKYIVKKFIQSISNPHEAKRNIKGFCKVARHLVKK
ncbi:MAG: radical SAM protein [Phycisphaerae bacterium]|nr:radical SAM protein [Phycisphaerae bacterium]